MKAIATCGVFFLLIWIVVFVNSQNDTSHVATIDVNIPDQGQIFGTFDITSWTNQTFMQFLGIPYAESPKGTLRFKVLLKKYIFNHMI